jgi:hypothetical protein
MSPAAPVRPAAGSGRTPVREVITGDALPWLRTPLSGIPTPRRPRRPTFQMTRILISDTQNGPRGSCHESRGPGAAGRRKRADAGP